MSNKGRGQRLSCAPDPHGVTRSVSRTLVTCRFCSCCCQRRMVSRRQIQMLMFPTSTDFPTPRMRMQRVELKSWRRSLMSRGFWWSSRTGMHKNTDCGRVTDTQCHARPRSTDEHSVDTPRKGRGCQHAPNMCEPRGRGVEGKELL